MDTLFDLLDTEKQQKQQQQQQHPTKRKLDKKRKRKDEVNEDTEKSATKGAYSEEQVQEGNEKDEKRMRNKMRRKSAMGSKNKKGNEISKSKKISSHADGREEDANDDMASTVNTLLLHEDDSIGASREWIKWFQRVKKENADEVERGLQNQSELVRSVIVVLQHLKEWTTKKAKQVEGNIANENKNKNKNDVSHRGFIHQSCRLMHVVVEGMITNVEDVQQRADIVDLCNDLLVKCMNNILISNQKPHREVLMQVFDAIAKHPESIFPRDYDVYMGWISHNLRTFNDEKYALGVAIQYNEHRAQFPIDGEEQQQLFDAEIFNVQLKYVVKTSLKKYMSAKRGNNGKANQKKDNNAEKGDSRRKRMEILLEKSRMTSIHVDVERLLDEMCSHSQRNDAMHTFIDSTSVAIYMDYLHRTRANLNMAVEKLCDLRLKLGLFAVNSIKSLNSSVNHLIKTKRVNLAHDLVTQTEKVAADIQARKGKESHIEPDVASYSILINGFAEEKNVKNAEAVLKHMKKRNVSPNVFTYNVLTKLYQRVGDQDKLKKISSMVAKEELTKTSAARDESSKKKKRRDKKKKNSTKHNASTGTEE